LSAGFIPNQPEKEITEMLSVTGRVFYYSRSNSWHPVPNYELPTPPQNQPKTREINPETKQVVDKEPLANKETVELKVSDNLAEPLKTIWLYCKEQGDWVTAKKMYQASKAVLKGKSVEQIRQYFGILSDKGYGKLMKKANRLGCSVPSLLAKTGVVYARTSTTANTTHYTTHYTTTLSLFLLSQVTNF
jgi:hypothetical protein